MRAIKWTAVGLVLAVAGCQRDAARAPNEGSAVPAGEALRRDLTLLANEGQLSAVSAVELGRVDLPEARGSREAPVEATLAADPRASYVLEPAAAPLPTVLITSVSPRPSATPAAINVSTLPRGASVGATTAGIVLRRPGRVSLDEPYEFAGLTSAYEPNRGGIRIGRGGSCGPTGVLEQRTPRY